MANRKAHSGKKKSVPSRGKVSERARFIVILEDFQSQLTVIGDGVIELQRQMMQVHKTLARHEARLDVIEAKLDVHTQILNSHTKILASHTKKLDEHSRILDLHTNTLGLHTQILGVHTKKLDSHDGEFIGMRQQLTIITSKLDAKIDRGEFEVRVQALERRSNN